MICVFAQAQDAMVYHKSAMLLTTTETERMGANAEARLDSVAGLGAGGGGNPLPHLNCHWPSTPSERQSHEQSTSPEGQRQPPTASTSHMTPKSGLAGEHTLMQLVGKGKGAGG